jgi:hypothetical protein
VNATALASPLSTDVTLISHKVEFSEDSSFASSDTIGAQADAARGARCHASFRVLH